MPMIYYKSAIEFFITGCLIASQLSPQLLIDRYEILYHRSHKKEPSLSSTDSSKSSTSDKEAYNGTRRSAIINTTFSLSNEDDDFGNVPAVHMEVTQGVLPPLTSTESADGLRAYLFTPSLNPQRSPNVLPIEIFELLESQVKFSSTLIQMRSHTDAARNTLSKASQDTSSTPTPSPSSNGLSSSQDGVDTLWNDAESKSRVRTNNSKPWGGQIGVVPRPSTVSTGERSRDCERESYQDSDKSRGRSKSAGRVRKESVAKITSSIRGQSSITGSRLNHMAKGTEFTSDANHLRTSSSALPSYTLINPILDEVKNAESDAKDLITANLSMYEGIPIHGMHLSEGDKEVMQSIRLAPHPLQLQSAAMIESLHAVSDCNKTGIALSLEKQILWQLDLLRVHDGERMERYEAFLWSKRSPNIEDQFKARSLPLKGPTQRQPHSALRRQKTAPVIEYYKDKGRQATK